MQASRVFVVTDDHTLIVDSRSRGDQRVGHINRAEDSSITEKPVLLIADSIIEIFPNNLPPVIDVVARVRKTSVENGTSMVFNGCFLASLKSKPC